MKPTFTLTRPVVLFLSLFFFLIAVNVRGQEGEAKALPRGVAKNWYKEAVSKIEDREYFIRQLESPGLYGAINHAQHLGYWFNPQGYSVMNFNDDGLTADVWRMQFVLAGVGREGGIRNRPLMKTMATGDHSVRMDYGDYALLYDNEKPGMEQSFLLEKRPSGAGPVKIVIGLKGDLAARAGAGDQLLLYTPGHPDDIKLTYDKLTVWDRNKKRLPAHLVLNGRTLVLTVDDRGAAYPVTVDPFAHGTSTVCNVENILGTTLNDVASKTLYGYSVNSAGDVNGDNVSDIIIGAPVFAQISGISGGNITGFGTISATGAVFIYFGNNPNGPSTSPSKVLQPTGLAAGALFGFSVATTGNASGAANNGVVIGAPGDQVGAAEGFGAGNHFVIGKAYVYTSASAFTGAGVTLGTAPDFTLNLQVGDFLGGSPNHSCLYGFSVADAGDLDGNGFDDLIVGSPTYNNTGRVDIYYGSSTGFSPISGTNIQGATIGENLGFSVSAAGKFNNDPLADVVIGAPGCIAATGGIITGHAYVFYGNAGKIASGFDNAATGSIGMTLAQPGNPLGTLFGFSVSTAGDVDGDNHGDLVVGAPLTLNSSGAVGSAYVFYGSNFPPPIFSPSHPTVTLTSPRAAAGANLLFGFSVANAGNVTGDAAGDILIGEPGSLAVSNPILNPLTGIVASSSTISGQAYVYAGQVGTGIMTSPRLTISDPVTPNLLGVSVHTAGDVDGDGVADFLIGEPSGVLDLGFDYTSLSIIPALGNPVSGTLTVGTSKGLLASGGIGTIYIYFGFSTLLPVNLLDFTGQMEGNKVLLNWATAQEENSSYFGIERSTDGQNFTAIGQVGAAGNSAVVTNYSYTDGSPSAGNNYYRLKMVDLDGEFVYSKVVVVNFSSASQQSVTTYPNPAHGSFSLLFKNMATGRYGVSLLNAIGQTLLTTNVQVSDPVNDNETINLIPSLAPGTYLIRIVDQQSKVTISRVILR